LILPQILVREAVARPLTAVNASARPGRDDAIVRAAGGKMEVVYFTVVAIVLYVAADWIVDRMEVWRGHRLPYRSILFFAILATLAVGSFAVLEHWTSP
jgi:hypothetical protein